MGGEGKSACMRGRIDKVCWNGTVQIRPRSYFSESSKTFFIFSQAQYG